MAGFDIKLMFQDLKELGAILKDFEKNSENVFKPAADAIKEATKNLGKIDQNAVQAIKAKNTGFSVNRNGVLIDKTVTDMLGDPNTAKQVKNVIYKLQREQAEILREENEIAKKRLEERKRENDLKPQSLKYRQDSLEFKKLQAQGYYNPNRAFTGDIHGSFSHALYQSSKNFANGNGAINQLTSSVLSNYFGSSFGNFIGKTVLGGIGNAVRRYADQVDENGNPTNWLGRFTRGVTAGGTKSGKGVNAAGGGIALAAESLIMLTSAAKNFNDKLIDSASNLEKLTAQLKVVSGSPGAAAESFAMIKNYALSSPYTITGTTEAATLLRQSGVLQSNLDKTIRMLGDLGMGNQERLNRLANNYSQILAAGRANARNLRQFTTAGIPIYKGLLDYAKTDPTLEAGNTTESIRKLTEEGKITSSIITKVLQKMTEPGGAFYQASDTYANTFSGKMTNLKDRLDVARGNATDLETNSFAKLQEWWLRRRIKIYEDAVSEDELTQRDIRKATSYEDKKQFAALAIQNKVGDKRIFSDDAFEKLSEEEKKTAISVSDYRKAVDKFVDNIENINLAIDFEKFGEGLTEEDVRRMFKEGFAESFGRRAGQRSLDYIDSLYQDNTTFAYKLSSSFNTYKEKSEYYKVSKGKENRDKFLETVAKYNQIDEVFKRSGTIGNIDVKNFKEIYEIMTSGYLNGTGRIEPQKNKKLFNLEDELELRTNVGRITNGVRLGFEENGSIPEYVRRYFESFIYAVDNINLEDGGSIDAVNDTYKTLEEKIEQAINSVESEKDKMFLSQLQKVLDSVFVSGYSVSDAPKDYFESYKSRILRNVSGLDAVNGKDLNKNIEEIQRKSIKALGSAVFNNKLSTSTIADLTAMGYLKETGGFNKAGGMNVDYEAMNADMRESFVNMNFAIKDTFVNLREFANDMKAYNEEVGKQIQVYTELERALETSEDKLSDAFYNMTESQQSVIATYGSVKGKDGTVYTDLKAEGGTLKVNIGDELNKVWKDVFDRKNGFTVSLDELTQSIKDSKTDLLMLQEKLAENTIVLSKINDIRDQSRGRRFSNTLNNSDYIYNTIGISADRGSEFYKNIVSSLSSVYSELMNLTLPNLEDQMHGNEIASGYMGGAYSYSQLRNIRNLQTMSPYWDMKTILKQLEIILGTSFSALKDEFKKSQESYDSNMKWRQVASSLTGLSYEEIKKDPTGGDVINKYRQLQSRDIFKNTITAMADYGYSYSDLAAMGVKYRKNGDGYKDTRYDWNKTQENLINQAMNGSMGLKTLTGLKNGLEASRKSITELSATLLTFTDTTNTNNKEITDVLKNYYVGDYLKGKLDGKEVDLEQYWDEETKSYGFRDVKTKQVIDTLASNFTFEKEFTQVALDKVTIMTDAMLSSVKLLETMSSSIDALEKDTRELKVSNAFDSIHTKMWPTNYNNIASGSEYSQYQDYVSKTINNAIGTFINNALDIADATKGLDESGLEKYVTEYNKNNGTHYDSDYFRKIIDNSKDLKSELDSNFQNGIELFRILSILGFDGKGIARRAGSFAEQSLISDRLSYANDLRKQFPTLYKDPTPVPSNNYVPGFTNRILSRVYGVEDYDYAVLSEAQKRSPENKNPDSKTIDQVKEDLKKAFGNNEIRRIQDSIAEAFDSFVIDNFNDSLKTTGKWLREIADGTAENGEAWKNFGKAFVNSTQKLTEKAGEMMVSAGLQQLILGNTVTGLALIAAGGASSIVSGFLDTKDDNDTEEKLKKLENLKADLKDLIAQAKNDAIYYEKNMSHKKALTTSQAISVNDAIITPSGNVISTHPDDYLIATKTPDTLMGGKSNSQPIINVNIKNNTDQKLTVTQTRTESNGEINIEAIIEGVVGKGIAEGQFDGALSARETRLHGSRVYM